MADITYCLTEACPMKAQCRRGQTPTHAPVSWAMFEWTGGHNSWACADFWPWPPKPRLEPKMVGLDFPDKR